MPKTKAATNVMQIDRLFFIIIKFSSYKNDFLIVLKYSAFLYFVVAFSLRFSLSDNSVQSY